MCTTFWVPMCLDNPVLNSATQQEHVSCGTPVRPCVCSQVRRTPTTPDPRVLEVTTALMSTTRPAVSRQHGTTETDPEAQNAEETTIGDNC